MNDSNRRLITTVSSNFRERAYTYSCRTHWCPLEFFKIGSSYLLYEVYRQQLCIQPIHTCMGYMHSICIGHQLVRQLYILKQTQK